MPYIKVNGIDIYHEIYGQGEPLIFVNGLYSNTQSWVNQIKYFQNDYQVIVYDCRDQGKTEVSKDNYEFNQHVKDLSALMEALGIEQANIVGVSHGSNVSMRFAVFYPQKVKNLVLLSGVSEESKQGTHTYELSRYLRDHYGMKIYYKMLMTYAVGEQYFEKIAGMIEDMANQFEAKSKESVSLYRILEVARQHYPFTSQLSKINAKTLILTGEFDRYTPVSRGKILNQNIKDSKFIIIEDSGHSLHLEKPEVINLLMLNFLKGKN